MFANLTLVTSTTTETTTTRPTARSTIYTPTATTSTPLIGWDVGSPDLISVAIVGSVFAVVLVVCIILGCREKKDQDPGKVPCTAIIVIQMLEIYVHFAKSSGKHSKCLDGRAVNRLF